MAFAPYLIVVALFAVTSFGPVLHFLESNSGPKFAWPGLEVLNSAGKPLSAATFNFNIFTAGGTVLLVAGILTAAALPAVGRAGRSARWSASSSSSSGRSSPSSPCWPWPT